MSDLTAVRSLRRWNIGVGAAHAVQALVLLVLANDFAIPVVSRSPTARPGNRSPSKGRSSTSGSRSPSPCSCCWPPWITC
ncbi:MAG: hypothetical protein OES57_00180 [Acidimicrobiia bacterium]|nr:hypothetical protein [Acidimicrobiia bacterium]